MALKEDNKEAKNLIIILLGSVKTGKSSYAKKIQGNKVDKNLKYNPTIGAAYYHSQITFEKKNFQLNFWDCSGQEKYNNTYFGHFIKVGDIFFFFYNSYDISSFERVKKMVDRCKQNVDKNPIFILIRSRYDECLENNDNKNIVSDEEALEYADLNNLYFAHLSNFEKNDTGFNELLENALKNFMN